MAAGAREAGDTGAVTRLPLPTDPWDLAPMGEAFASTVGEVLAALGLADTAAAAPGALRSYEAHARLLRAWGEAINLTAIREPVEVARRHVGDSLSAAPRLAELLRPGASLLDLGSGSGYPGLPLGAALPLGRLALVESVGKKAHFLAVAGAAVADALGADDGPVIEAVAERAEDLAEDAGQREAWDVITARAVGSLAEVLELALPLTRVGGWTVAWKRESERGGLHEELRASGSIIRAAGGGRPEVLAVDMCGLSGHRLVFIPKERPTPLAYPRAVALRRPRRSTRPRLTDG
jgi:16S rRNA (guanine527-N7)-methyltransferase